MEVMIITASWDVNLGFIKYHCKRLLNKGIRCKLTMINDGGSSKELLIKYGSRDGIVKVPVVLILSESGVNIIDVYQLGNL
ncbi:hypothetical protein [Caldivirga sp. UBA161]|uniref:hypothetical protein n=1 Tax=Caldivirga sp. UBA161 TaxID=1915569 RepID=UPI0025C25CB9|nr:hypothetical protein [Caldivirga sp. UBA161]